MSDLVEQKLKKLHYFPPNFRVQPPHSILAAHPLLASIPKKAFRREVSHMAPASCKPALHTSSTPKLYTGEAQVQPPHSILAAYPLLASIPIIDAGEHLLSRG